ncbi:MAG: hypothetical protein H6541_11100 [Lentimicrobiaceae bacterium]|nr:hypothetical protein [Lentimicrobiaceae bacterium]
MKTNIIILLSILGLIALNILPFTNLKAEPVKEYHWKQINCSDGVNWVEICSDNGDGNRCYGGGQSTRKCPGGID